MLSAGLTASGLFLLAACGAAGESEAGEGPAGDAGHAPSASEPSPSAAAADAHAGESGPGSAAVAPSAAPEAATVTVEFTTSHTVGPRGETVRFALDTFAERQPSVFVEYQTPGPDYAEWVAATLASGTGPHVVFGDASTFQRHRDEHLLEISQPAAEIGWQADAYYFIPDTYTDNRGDLRVPPSRQHHGPLYGLPYSVAIDGWLVNESLFQQAGAQPPGGPWTWNDALDLGRQLTDPAQDRWGILALNSPEFFWIPLLYGNGVKRPFLEDGSATGWLIDGDAASEAFEWAVDLIHQWEIAPPVNDVPALARATGDPFSGGHVAMWPSGAIHSTGFLAPRIADRFGWALVPSPASPRTGVAAHAWQGSAHFVTRRAAGDHLVEPAVALAAHLGSEEVQRAMAAARGSLPARISATSVSAAIAPPPENLPLLRGALEDPQTRHLFIFFATWPQWLAAQVQAAAGAFLGSVSPEQALLDMVRGGDQVLSAWWATPQAQERSGGTTPQK